MTESPGSPLRRLPPGLVSAVVLYAVLTALVWGRTAGHGFVWDDRYFIVTNTALRDGGFVPSYFTDISTMAGEGRGPDFAVFRPLRNISYLLDFEIAGLSPGWWHVHNLLLHLLNAVLVYLIAGRLLRNTFAAWIAGAVFLLHPVQSEAVAWVKCRDDLLSTAFVLGAFLLWLRWRPAWARPARILALAALYAAACLTKIQAVILPLLLAAAEFWMPRPEEPGGRAARRQAAGTAAGLMALGLALLAWRHAVIGHTAQAGYLAGSLWPTLLTMTRAGAQYIALLVFPLKLVADYSGMEASTALTDPRVIGSVLLLAAAAAATLAARRRWAVATFGVVWAAVSLLPVSNLVAMMQFMAERFLYLPMAGFALAAAALFEALQRKRAALATALAGIVLGLYGIRSFYRADVWRNDETLFAVTVRDTPETAVRARRNLVDHLLNAGRYREALPLARRLWESNRDNEALPPRARAEYAHHLGLALARTGKTDEGADLLRRAAALDPTYESPVMDLGVLEGEAGRANEALDHLNRARAIAPHNSEVLYNRGVAFQSLRRTGEAESSFREAIAAVPTSPLAHKALAALLWQQGRIGEAVTVYRAALDIWPADPEARRWLEEGLRELQSRTVSKVPREPPQPESEDAHDDR